jgi:RNA 3'-terminal phosphate cyclase (ATP)
MKEDVIIDGSMGEAGGQVLRTSLALSLVTGRSLRIKNIRAGRKQPGLLRQHLTAVNASVEIGNAEIQRAALGSTDLFFSPRTVRPGEYTFSVGTAGSTTLVLQTVLPALMTAGGPSRLVIEGGTHNPFAPPFEFLHKCFIPCMMKMGPRVSCILERPGYYPSGGGKIAIFIEPVGRLIPFDINDRGESGIHRTQAVVCDLSPQIGRRELAIVKNMLKWEDDCLHLVELHNAKGPGNVLVSELVFENITEVFTGFGERGVSAEKVAERSVKEVVEYLDTDAPVGKYLADQLLLPFAIAGGGAFRTLPPTKHTLTNIDVIRKFLDVDIRCEKIDKKTWRIWIRNKRKEVP